jgi:hypothetical protein
VVYRLLADVVVSLHMAYLLFIPLGGFLAWRWRALVGPHIAAVVVGLVSITVGFECPLTAWENSLRERGAEQPYAGGFIDHYLTGRLYPHGYDIVVQTLMGTAVIAAYAFLIRRSRQ